MADDVVALMDVPKVPKADIVGWSDGAILGLDPYDAAFDQPWRIWKRAHLQLPIGDSP